MSTYLCTESKEIEKRERDGEQGDKEITKSRKSRNIFGPAYFPKFRGFRVPWFP